PLTPPPNSPSNPWAATSARRRQACSRNACRRSCPSDSQRYPQHPSRVLRATNSAQVGRSTDDSTRETATVNPAASSSLFTFRGVFTSSCQESFSLNSAAPAASSSWTHWVQARLSRSLPQVSTPVHPPPSLSA